MFQTVPLFGAIPGGPEMLIILLVLVLLFGANKIPKLARSTGQAMGEFQKGRTQVEEELKEMQEESTEVATGETDAGATEPDTAAADESADETADEEQTEESTETTS